jgi:hypothetical protein
MVTGNKFGGRPFWTTGDAERPGKLFLAGAVAGEARQKAHTLARCELANRMGHR